MLKLQPLMKHLNKNVFNQANQELNAFANAKAQEYRQYQEQKVGELVKEKKLDVVIEKGAVVGGGSDVTDDLIAKMGKALMTKLKKLKMQLKHKNNKMHNKMLNKQVKLQQLIQKVHNN